MKKNKKQTNFKLSENLIKLLNELSKNNNMTKTEIVELGILEIAEQFIKTNNKK